MPPRIKADLSALQRTNVALAIAAAAVRRKSEAAKKKKKACDGTTEYTRPVATGGIVKTIFPHNFPKNDAQDLKKWSRKTRPVFLYNL